MGITRETLKLIEKARAAIGRLADAAVRVLTAAWAREWDRLADDFAAVIAELMSRGEARWPTRKQVLASAAPVLRSARAALGRLVPLARREATGNAEAAARMAGGHQEEQVRSQLPRGVPAGWTQLGDDALAQIIRRVQQRIHALHIPLAPEAEAALKRELVRGVAEGRNPNQVARDLLRRLEGAFTGGLQRATVIARTEMLDSYRAAAMAAQLANSETLSGWMWLSAANRRTCFPAGTRITTQRGQVPIERVEINDSVLTHMGRWRKVHDTMSQRYSGAMVTIRTGLLAVTATADHLFLVERQCQLHWLEARDIRAGDRVLSDRECSADGGDHGFAEVAIERRDLHRHIVSEVHNHFRELTVYNFEVEEDHSYIAEGVAVHNCPSCWAMHGTIHPLDEPGPQDHQAGRCSRTPVARPWRDLGINIDEPPSLVPDAQAAFWALSRADQLAVMGPTRLAALQRGDIDWADLSTLRRNTGWRDSYTTTRVADLVGS